jgi:hypothetical protein
MDRFPQNESYRGIGRTAEAWTTTPASDPIPARGRSSELLLVAAMGALLLDTFAPWQRLCVNLSTSFFHLNGCISANAWSGNGGGFGIAAGICTILACMALVLHLAGALEGATTGVAERVLVYAAVGTGAVKWLLVIDKAAAVGAWVGVLLLFVVAVVETVRTQASGSA